jgi:hypothetical protein
MREFLNAPNGAAQPAVSGNGRQESGSPQSPLGGKTVCIPNLLYRVIIGSPYLLTIYMVSAMYNGEE